MEVGRINGDIPKFNRGDEVSLTKGEEQTTEDDGNHDALDQVSLRVFYLWL